MHNSIYFPPIIDVFAMGTCTTAPKSSIASKTREKQLKSFDPHKRYQFGKCLGTGASARVIEAIDNTNGQRVALKILSKEKQNSKNLYTHEVDMLSKLNHQHIIEFIGATEDQLNYYISTRLYEGGALLDRITDPQFRMTERRAALMVHDMLSAIQHLHSVNIVHRDLKPENFVFDSDCKNLVLIDFGCAKLVSDDEEYHDLVGTVYYVSPELAAQSTTVRKTGSVLKSSDIWSVGVIAYVLLTGRLPFSGKSYKEIFTSIIRDELSFPSAVGLFDDGRESSGFDSFKDFVYKTLVKDPAFRISIEDAINHPWVQGITASERRMSEGVIIYLGHFKHQSKLKKAISQFLASNMRSQPEQSVKEHFERLDKDKNGYLDEEELSHLLMDMGFTTHTASREANSALHAADKNTDGLVDFEEFKLFWHRKLLSQHTRYSNGVFSLFDNNGDGQIDADELTNLLGIELKRAESMLCEVDKDGDGLISLREFQMAMQERNMGSFAKTLVSFARTNSTVVLTSQNSTITVSNNRSISKQSTITVSINPSRNASANPSVNVCLESGKDSSQPNSLISTTRKDSSQPNTESKKWKPIV
eukprot:490421_1